MILDEIKTLVDEFIAAGGESIAAETLANKLETREITPFAVVESLGSTLTNESPEIRSKGIGLLSRLIERYDGLNEEQIAVLVEFFLARLQDGPSVPEAEKMSFLGLSQSKPCYLNARMFAELSVQSYIQTTRLLIFRLLSVLIANHSEVIAERSVDFIPDFIQAVDGEKDPRNLVLVFKMFVNLVSVVPVEDYGEDLFEVVACYYPITFRPPPDDPYGITADQLKSELKQCLLASVLFAPFAVPLFLEKLSSSIEQAQRDALDCIAEATVKFGIGFFAPHLDQIWQDCVKVLQSSDDLSVGYVMRALIYIAKGISSTDKLLPFLGRIEKEAFTYLDKDEETKHSRVYGRVFSSLSGASKQTWSYVFPRSYGWAASNLKKATQVRSRQVFEYLADVLMSGKALLIGETSLLAEHTDAVLDLIIGCLSDDRSLSSTKAQALRALCFLLEFPEDFAQDKLTKIVHQLKACLSEDVANSLVCLNAMKLVEHKSPCLVESIVMNDLGEDSEELVKSLFTIDEFTEKVLKRLITIQALPLLSECLWKDEASSLTQDALQDAWKVLSANVEQLVATKYGVYAGIAGISRNADAWFCDAFCEVIGSIASEQTRIQMIASYCLGANADAVESLVSRIGVHDLLQATHSPALDVALIAVLNKSSQINEELVEAAKNTENVRLMASACCSLILRSSRKGYELLNDYLAILRSDKAKYAADSFSLICFPPDFVQKSNHFRLSQLMRHKLFVTTVPLLRSGYETVPVEMQSYWLLCFSLLVRSVPKEIMISEIKSDLTLLLQALESTNVDLLDSMLVVFVQLLSDAPEVLNEHAGYLVKQFTRLSTMDFPMKIRMDALKATKELTKLKYEAIFPYKKQIVKHLLKCVGDPKRLVRKEAMDARNEWLLLQ